MIEGQVLRGGVVLLSTLWDEDYSMCGNARIALLERYVRWEGWNQDGECVIRVRNAPEHRTLPGDRGGTCPRTTEQALAQLERSYLIRDPR